MPYIKMNGINIYYEDVGVGFPILFLHSSFSRGILSFSSQIYQFQYAHRCLLPDFRGHGRTESQSIKWSSSLIADDMYNFLQELKIMSAHIVGYSLGGTVALYLAVRYPQIVRSLTAISATATVTSNILKEADEFEPDVLTASDKWKTFIELQRINHVQANHGDWKGFICQSIEDWRIHPSISEAELHTIQVPSLFIYGERDSSITDEDITYISKNIASSRIEIISECNHRPHMVGNKPEKVNDIILEFLKNIEN